MSLYIGLMSGTSMDGIDAALINAKSNKLLCAVTKKYSKEVKNRLVSILNAPEVGLASICQLNTLIGLDFGKAAQELLHEAKIPAEKICAIGSHGQTLCHNTNSTIPYTLQLGCAHTISSLTGITVVADFRTRDLVNGGQAAPFAPLYHQTFFAKNDSSIALINIGGIANMTVINAHEPAKGWDLGPGNCLMDAWIAKHQSKEFDKDGSWAKKGKLIEPLLTKLLADKFILEAPPKSFGKEYFSLQWLSSYLDNVQYSPVDVQKTLAAFTAQVIANALIKEQNIKTVYLCGGGSHNTLVHQMISDLVPKIDVKNSSEVGINPDYVEAMMFAWLAAQTINKKPVDLSTITGSKGPAILGAIYPKTPVSEYRTKPKERLLTNNQIY